MGAGRLPRSDISSGVPLVADAQRAPARRSGCGSAADHRLRRIAPRAAAGAAIGNARARCLSCPDGRLPFCRDACGIDHADAGLGAFGDGNGPMALSGGGTGQRRTALCAALATSPEPAQRCRSRNRADVVRYVGRMQIVLRSGDAYARRAMGASVRSTSGLRPTAE